ncbi:TorD/DmsD family molecular chaperone [Methylobacterium dankookense]|uniref:Chaperone protein TorD n=1 Tax=Methylobacterium dankookense TaxID=560405 RepID=A0A564G6A2_9HYPH|nr:molecular chaperone TorD family protein [Methylobacterium dankookense]GJD55288.1 Chaperone protein TorD [Methylobacterium dankookense]VUF15592.1 Chaperone protein TorD [Methylobacterium dankookense]
MGSVASALREPAGEASVSGGRVDEVDVLRAEHYDLLAVLLGRAPEQFLLDGLAALTPGGGVLGRAVAELSRAAAQAQAEAVEREFFELFIGVGRGELLPYASYYLTGFLNERPLARIRADLTVLGLARVDGMSEPEDHLAFLLEVMAGLAAGRFGAGDTAQARFFAQHVAPWAGRFFADLEGAKAARFYRAVGGLGQAFLSVETEAFAMDA